MTACGQPVVWGLDEDVQVWCDAAKPCPYHDRNGLTAEQRRQWRITWAMQAP
jgi:hypothetical protein